ncbi:hypothetical protein BN977_01247 [Mycolicibacterium cosmeticum]|uniref:Uncharacterized protein n=1 Tax=Mycolicibacterium cosmeticum TaxID=258533 RepID=W9AU71_MYCCO|nr:hypothetical protein BN977_01247 [Mycolicibacterium cosmeticum]
MSPELRQLAQAILDRLDPAVRLAAARAAAAGAGEGRCQQVWCPVCALAALVAGEQHPLLSVIAEHSVALLAIVRAMVGEPASAGPPPPDGTPPPPADGEQPPKAPGRYESIRVDVED